MFKKQPNKEFFVEVIASIKGSDSDLYISRFTDGWSFNFNFIKPKYSHIEKLQKWDTLVFQKEKLEKLIKWVIDFDSSTWTHNGYFDQEKCLVLECDCISELLVTYFDPDDKMFYFEIFDNHWYSKKYHKKMAHSFGISMDKAKIEFKKLFDILDKLKYESTDVDKILNGF